MHDIVGCDAVGIPVVGLLTESAEFFISISDLERIIFTSMAGQRTPATLSSDPSSSVEERTTPAAGVERRNHERYELDLEGGLSRDGEQFVPCRVRDFCLGGMLLVPSESSGDDLMIAGKPIVSDDSLVARCAAEVAGEHQNHKVRVRVVSVSSRGIGVSFDRDESEGIWRITQLVRKLKEVLLEKRTQERETRAPSSPMVVEQAINAGQLLEDARRRIEKFVVVGMEASFKEADEWLFTQARDAPSNTEEAVFTDAMNELKGLKLSVESAFIDAMDRGLNALGQPASQGVARVNDDSDMELALLDTGSFDDWLVSKNIISAAEPQLQDSQFDLEQRLSLLVSAAIDEENNPIGIMPLCLAFHESIQDLGASRRARHAMLHGFDKAVVQSLGSLYDDLNTMFVEGGVLPTVERPSETVKISSGAASRDSKASTESRVSAESAAISDTSDARVGSVPATSSEGHAPAASVPAPAAPGGGHAPAVGAPTTSVVGGGPVAAAPATPGVSDGAAASGLAMPGAGGGSVSSGHGAPSVSGGSAASGPAIPGGSGGSAASGPAIPGGSGGAAASGPAIPGGSGGAAASGPAIPGGSGGAAASGTAIPGGSGGAAASGTAIPGGRGGAAPPGPATSGASGVASTGGSEPQSASGTGDQGASSTLPALRVGNAFRAAGTLIALQSEVDPTAAAEFGQFSEGMDGVSSRPSPNAITAEQQRILIDNLSILQRSPRFSQSSESGPLNLNQKLRATWRSAGLDVGEHDRMMAVIVSNLVDAILEDPFLNEETKVRVRRLAVPILKVAIQDGEFFNDKMHPARQVLDSLGSIAPGSAESLANIIDPVVNDIVGKYENDPRVFSDALDFLKTALSEQRRVFQQNIEEVVAEREKQQAFVKARQKEAGVDVDAKAKKSPGTGVDNDSIESGIWSRWLAQAQRCKPGDILSMEGQNGQRDKLFLAWVSEDKGTFVLVDSQGKKVMSLTAQEFAMHIKRGTATVEDTANMALTDRGTYRMLRSIHKRLSRNASHDRLTDLLKRKDFEARLDDLITEAVRDASHHVMYGLEFGGLKRVVEIAGKGTAKRLLKKLAQVIEKQVAKRGVVGRLGTARFGVLLNNVTTDEARKLIERHCLTLAKSRRTWRGEQLPLTVSIGMVEITPMSQGVTATLAELESAVDNAVEAGGNRIELGGSVDDPYAGQGLLDAGGSTVLDFLDTDRLRLRCQRVMPLAEDPSTKPHYEILLGVQQDEHTVSLPSDFIRAAERNNEMQTVDRWVIRSTFQWIRDNPSKVKAADGYSINLSSNALSDEGVLEFVLKQFSETEIPPAKIIFEFPETAAAANVASTADFVTTLKTYGCRFAIDNFGMAESSFSFLSSLPVDYVKINGRLVVDILDNSKDLAVVKSINEIGHLLGKQTIAEFVENEELLTRVRELGVDYAQGFGIEHPSLLESV